MVDLSKYCIIIPAYNAAEQIKILIEKIRDFNKNIFIFVINDGSTDHTVQQVPMDDKNLALFSHFKNRGKGAAILTGIKKAQQRDYPFAIFLDSDLQHDPTLIPDFIDCRENTGADMVIGVRSKRIGKMPIMRILSNFLTSLIISMRCKYRIRDSQCGYRLIDIDSIETSSFKYQGFQFESEFLIKALDSNMKVEELKINTIYSDEKSSINNIFDTLKFIKLYLDSFFWI